MSEKTTSSSPREAKGGTFSPADIPLIKAALHAYVKAIDSEHPDISKAANLLHRLGRIS